jgi:Acyl-CoA reductase (LuxC)
MHTIDIPLIIRGEMIETDMVEFPGRSGRLVFRSPDVKKHLDRLPLADPTRMADMYADLSFDDIGDYLDELGSRLSPERNPYVREAYELSCTASGLTPEILNHHYSGELPAHFRRANVREIAESRIGIQTLEGWTRQQLGDGRIAHTRPFGARCMHITAGNSPICAAITTIWNAITRGDAVIKAPSNDPLTSAAIGRTMIDMAPHHPLTKHYSVAYWKGGDTHIESALYSPNNFEKVVAWGGFESMRHITRYLQPGLELVAMDPKLSATIVGEDAFESAETMQRVAELIAIDFGSANQEGCANARVISVQSGTDDAGLAKLNELADMTYAALRELPLDISAPHPDFDPVLREEIQGIRNSPFYRVFGGDGNHGAVIASQTPDPVDFADRLACRVANFVPIDDIDEALRLINIHTQTVGVYPEHLKGKYRDELAFRGAQRIVSLGHNLSLSWSLPHDGIEPVRRLCRWVNDENCQVESFQSTARISL